MSGSGKESILEGCVIATHENIPDLISDRIKNLARSLGGIYSHQVTNDTTHLIWFHAKTSYREYQAWIRNPRRVKCHIVFEAWLDGCRDANFRVSESLYSLNREEDPLYGLKIYISGSIDSTRLNVYEGFIETLGGSFWTEATKHTIVCVEAAADNAAEIALARNLGTPVVYTAWLLECLRTGELRPLQDYNADIEASRHLQTKISRNRMRKHSALPLSGCKVFLRHSVPRKTRLRIEDGVEKLGGEVQPATDKETTHIVTTREDYESYRYKFINHVTAEIVDYAWLENCIRSKSKIPKEQWLLPTLKKRTPGGIAILCEPPAGESLATLAAAIKKLGGRYCSEVTEDTEYICAAEEQVTNLTRSIVRAGQSETTEVVRIEWLLDSIREGKFVDWNNYFQDVMEEEYRPPLHNYSIVVAASWPHSEHAEVRDEILKLGGAYQMCVDNHTSHVCMSWKDFEDSNVLVSMALYAGKTIVDHKWLLDVIREGRRIPERRYRYDGLSHLSDGEYEED